MDATATAEALSSAPRIPRAFEQMPDPRRNNSRHKLSDVLNIALFAVICGADGWAAVAEYGRAKFAWLRTFLELPHGIPSHDTFGDVFAKLQPEAFEHCFMEWMKKMVQLSGGQLVASRLCRIALNLLKAEKTATVGVAIKRQKCGWNNDYLLKVVAASAFGKSDGPEWTMDNCPLPDWTASARGGKTMILMFAKHSDRTAQVSEALKLAAQSVAAGKAGEAVRICRNLLANFPNDARVHYALGVALGHTGQVDPAIDELRQAIRLKPDLFEAHTNLGVLLGNQAKPEEAIAAFAEAIRLRPDVAELHVNLSNALRENWMMDQAIAAAQKAIALKPTLPEAQLCLGTAAACVGRFDRAIDAYRNAIRLRPDFPAAHLDLALAELVTGNLDRGWPEYEWRRQCPAALPPRQFAQATWKGQPLDGKTILLHAEQGFGDAIHFIRYAPLVAARGGRIVLECQPALVRLFGNFPGVGQIVTPGQPLPAFDYQCPLPSLPGVFRTTIATIPATIPYLAADAEAADSWRRRMKPSGEFLHVGLAWAGKADNRNDRNRSIPLERFSPLSAAGGVRFHSLQTAPPPAAGGENLSSGIALSDWSALLTDFAETAALIENLDLVISVDTAVAHLAGAMGKAVWLLVPFPPDWRWLLDREDSPWYPTIRLFRRETAGDWDGVIRRVAAELSQHKSNRG